MSEETIKPNCRWPICECALCEAYAAKVRVAKAIGLTLYAAERAILYCQDCRCGCLVYRLAADETRARRVEVDGIVIEGPEA
jgi:hypothetical protein